MSYKKYLKSFSRNLRRSEFAPIIALLIFALIFNVSVNKLKQGEDRGGLATLAVNFETGKRLFEGEVYTGMTILDALNAAMSVGKIKLNYALDDKNQTQIMEIDGYTNNTGGKSFLFYLNNKEVAPQNLNKVRIEAGDKIEILFQ